MFVGPQTFSKNRTAGGDAVEQTIVAVRLKQRVGFKSTLSPFFKD